MSATAVGVDEQGIHSFQGRVVIDRLAAFDLGGPAIGIHLHLQIRHTGQRFLEQQATSPELVHAGGMAGTSGDECNTSGLGGVLGQQGGGWRQQQGHQRGDGGRQESIHECGIRVFGELNPVKALSIPRDRIARPRWLAGRCRARVRD